MSHPSAPSFSTSLSSSPLPLLSHCRTHLPHVTDMAALLPSSRIFPSQPPLPPPTAAPATQIWRRTDAFSLLPRKRRREATGTLDPARSSSPAAPASFPNPDGRFLPDPARLPALSSPAPATTANDAAGSFSFDPGDSDLLSRKQRWDTRTICLTESHIVRVSRRLFVGIGALTFAKPALSLPSQEEKDSDIIRYRKLDNGVKIQDIIEGNGPEAHEGDLVKFNYVCRRSNGYFVHSTVDQFNGESKPVVLYLDEKQMIQGLKDVIVGMKAGGKRRALIPPNVGYVNENLKPIPDEFGPRRSLLSHAKEPLVFEVQLLKVL